MFKSIFSLIIGISTAEAISTVLPKTKIRDLKTINKILVAIGTAGINLVIANKVEEAIDKELEHWEGLVKKFKEESNKKNDISPEITN